MNIQRGIAKEEKKVLIYSPEKREDDGYNIYYEKGYSYLTKKEYEDMRNKPRSAEFVMVPIDKLKLMKRKPMKEIYDEFVAEADEMKLATNGLINMYISGRETKTAIELAYHFLNENKIFATQIKHQESQWLEKASLGALTFSEPYTGEIHTYDINSSYPSIYSNNYFMMPTCDGEYKTLTKAEFQKSPFYQFGIYKVKISYPDKKRQWHKIFKLNSSDYYTHYDLSYAKELKLDIDLIEDGQSNFLYYSRDKLKTGGQLFKKFVDVVYPLRQNAKIKDTAKALLRSLWGALCQYNLIKKIFKYDGDESIADTRTVLKIEPIDDKKYRVEFYKNDMPYETNWARMKPFLLSKGRIKISKLIEPHAEHVKRCHTDSMMCAIKLPYQTSTKLGDLKYEGCANVEVKNMRRPEIIQSSKGTSTKSSG
jgi:hypothetical protein